MSILTEMSVLRDFTSGNIAKQMLAFSLPMLIGNLFQQMYSMVDAVVVGRFVSGDALAAVGVSLSALGFITAVLIGLTTGASVLISQFYGSKQLDRLKLTVSTSIIALFGLSVIITLPGTLFTPQILKLLNAPADIMDNATLYMRILMVGMICPIFFNMYTAYLRAMGDSRNPLYILICATLLNTGLDLFFVLVLDLGIFGVALATVIAQFTAAVLCYLLTRIKVPILHVTKLIFDRKLFAAILKYGAPAALQLSLVTLASLTITRLINSFGAAAMSGITAVTKIDQIAIMPVSTLSMAMSTFVGQNMGAQNEERARRGFKTALVYMLAISVVVSGLMLLFSSDLISLFISQSDPNAPEIMRIGNSYLSILVIFYFLFAFLFGFNGFFRGVGDAVIAMVFPVCSLTIRTASAYALVYWFKMGPEALALSIPIGWGLCSFASWIYYKKRLWVGKSIV